jgi:hypothetical protein
MAKRNKKSDKAGSINLITAILSLIATLLQLALMLLDRGE